MAYAGTWQTAIALPATVEYDTNPLLDTDNEKGVTRTIIAPDYSLKGTFGRDQYRLGLGLNVERSSDTSVVLDREDPNVLLGWQRENDKGGFGLTANYAETSTLSTGVQETGVVAPDGTQKLYSLGGNWRRALTERSTLVNETQYTVVDYDIDSLTSYDEASTQFSWNYAWSERVELFTRFAARRYEPDSGSAFASSNSYSPTAGVKFEISERLKGTLYGGINHVTGEQSDTTGQGGFNLIYTGERIDTSIDIGRSMVASGEGGFVEVDAVQGTWSYALDETSRAGLDASWQDSKGGQTPNTLETFGAWVSRELSPFWLVRLSFIYKERQQDGLPDANANVLGMTLIYNLPDF